MISCSPDSILTYPSNVADSVFDLERLARIREKLTAPPPPIRFWVTSLAKKFTRRPRSKKKRIIWKWKKREENWTPTLYRINKPTEIVIVIHPELHAKLVTSIANESLLYRHLRSATQASPITDL